MTACPTPEKRRYRTRHDARQALKTWKGRKSRKGLRPYRCDPGCGEWHLGHLGPDIIAGKASRQEVYGT